MTVVYVNDVYINSNTFTNNQIIEEVDCNYTKWENNSMYCAFNNCSAVYSITNINENVSNMEKSFMRCLRLINAPEIPNSVVNMGEAFAYCYNMVNSPSTIPNSVTNMSSTFYKCYNLTTTPVVPNSVVNMCQTFFACSNIASDVFIQSNKVNMASSCFTGQSRVNAYIPFTYENGVNSATYNAFTLAGYTEEGIDDGVHLRDYASYNSISNDYITVETAGITYLNTYNSSSNNVITPKYGDNSVQLVNTCYKNNEIIENVNLNNTSFNNNTMHSAFNNCYNLKSVSNIPQSITNMGFAYYHCYNLTSVPTIPNSVNYIAAAFEECHSLVNFPDIPDGVLNLQATYKNCYSMVKSPIIPSSVTAMRYTFAGCNSLTGNIFIESENITSILDTFVRTDLQKNVYVQFKNLSNESNTATYNSFINAGYDEIGTTNGVHLRDYDTYNSINALFYTGNSNNKTVLISYKGLSTGFTVPKYGDDSIIFESGCFAGNDKIDIVDLNNIPYEENNMAEAFSLCYGLTYVNNINPNTTNMYRTFENCEYLAGDIYIPSEVVSNASNCFTGTSLTKNVYIPYQNNGVNTATYNAFISAGYDEIGTKEGVYLKDLTGSTEIDVSDYEYTLEDKTVTLTKYVGDGGDVVIPNV